MSAQALIERARVAAAEIAAEGHMGWGNTVADLADALERLTQPVGAGVAVQRYSWGHQRDLMTEDSAGGYVRFEDHTEIVARLQALTYIDGYCREAIAATEPKEKT